MSDHFKSYVNNLNRVRLAEMIDHHGLVHRSKSFRASLIANPLTGLPYYAAQSCNATISAQPAV